VCVSSARTDLCGGCRVNLHPYRDQQRSRASSALCVVVFAAAALVAADAPARHATLDGMRIHYESYGTGKQAVVFIHGWTCDLTFWRMQAPVYEKHRSLLIDLPGHGESDKPEIAYTQDFFARAV